MSIIHKPLGDKAKKDRENELEIANVLNLGKYSLEDYNYNSFVKQLSERAKAKGYDYTEEDYKLLIDNIGLVESKDSNVVQKIKTKRGIVAKGPASGYYQIEDSTLPTAVNRYNNIIREYGFKGMPVIELRGRRAKDFSKEEQKLLALSNMIKGAVSKGDVLNPKDAKNSWIKYHWKGKEVDRKDRELHWDNVINNI